LNAVSCPRCAHLNSQSEPSCIRCGAILDSSGSIAPGSVVESRYRIEREIGAGATGRVYEAFDTDLSRRVALKILSPELIHHKTARARMAREAQSLGRIRHDNVVRINNVFTMGESLVLDLELLTGGTLADRIASGPCTGSEALSLMQSILSGLRAIHEAGVVHRDMKPANILLTADGQPKIADLGIAHELDGVRITKVGTRLGTPQYMSPEQIRGYPVGVATDIYACGVIFFELLTGDPPFDCDSEFDIQEAHVKTPPDLRKLAGRAPEHVIEALRRALAKDPDERWRTAAELAAALASESPAVVAVRTPTPPIPAPVTIRREPEIPPLPLAPVVTPAASPAKWFALGLAAAVLVGGGAWCAASKSPSRNESSAEVPERRPIGEEARRPAPTPPPPPTVEPRIAVTATPTNPEPEVVPDPPATPPPPPETHRDEGTYASIVVPEGYRNGRVKEQPEMDSPVKIELPAGTRVRVVSPLTRRFWFQVEYDTVSGTGRGWMHRDVLSLE